MQVLSAMYPHFSFFSKDSASRFSMFDKVCGSDQIRLLLSKRMQVDDILPFWRKDEVSFRKIAKKYYLYH
jgi:uncharacterized protein YbbC (DUF1343 family)